jgi:hypothetical protein
MHMRVRIKVDATDMDIKEQEMSVITVEEGTFIDIKEVETSVVKFEEMLADTKEENFTGTGNSPTVKTAQEEVSYTCVCPLLDTFCEYPILCTIIYCVYLCLCERNCCTVLNGETFLLRFQCQFFQFISMSL